MCFLPRLPSMAVPSSRGAEGQTLVRAGQPLHQEPLCSLGSSRNLGCNATAILGIWGKSGLLLKSKKRGEREKYLVLLKPVE